MSKKKYGTVNATILTWVNKEYFLNDTETANVNTFAVLSNTKWCIIDIMDRDIRVNCKDMSKATQHGLQGCWKVTCILQILFLTIITCYRCFTNDHIWSILIYTKSPTKHACTLKNNSANIHTFNKLNIYL